MMADLHPSEYDDAVFPELFRPAQKTPVPAVGSFVRLAMRNDFSPNIYKSLTYRVMGRVINLQGRDHEPGTFSIFVDYEEVPTRVMRMRDVHSINGERVHGWAVAALPPAPRTQVFDVTGSKGDAYRVEVTAGAWSCTCKGFAFKGQCRHIAGLQNAPQRAAKARA